MTHTPPPVEHTEDLSPLELAAIAKAGQPAGWRPYYFEVAIGGLLAKGCMTRPKMRGPNKGEPKYLLTENHCQVIVTPEDVEAFRTPELA